MKNILLILLLTLLLFSVANSQQNNWRDINETEITLVGNRYIIPDLYRTVKLNLDELRPSLDSAPMEFTQEAVNGTSILVLPLPDGSFQKFNFWESPTMEPELQAKFPEIRTYSGQGIDDPYATLKFDLTPQGFHAQILSPNGRVFIDPYSMGDINNYISYYTRDYKKVNDDFKCEVQFDEYSIPEPKNYSEMPVPPTGPQLRTYRLANAATGEYTAFHGGTVPAGLAAVTTSVNRVNGVYEKEVAVRMVLVANNNLIIYTNPNTDPYTNNSGGTMLGENQSNLDAVIGNSNYDIGHVFSTGGGGVAYLGVICVTNFKARGVTGSYAPIGDPFDIDYVAHEMGHQFDANHTFNGNAGSCSGNRNASTAYEPGSGSTIMAYAGICGSQDLQNHSNAYFHVVSFDEIRTYTTTGSGNGCPVITNTGNNAPIVTVPSGGFYIPKSTPFALTGSATDPNGDAMTYCWEEFDLGPAGAPGSPSGNAPIFRSFNPTSSSTRTFPKLSDLLNNTSTIGEILPTYARNLTFRLTVRDNRAGGGGVDWNQVAFNVDGNSGPFVVTSPNTSVSWTGNTQQTVTWNVANTNGSPVNCTTVRILLSTNGGNSFTTELIASTPNDGSEIITLPNLPTSQARIKVEAVGNIFFDISNFNFNILNNPIVNDPLTFNATGISYSQIDLSFTPNAGSNNVIIVWNLDGTFTTPAGAPPIIGSPFAGGTLLSNGISSPVNHTGLSNGTTYYYKAFSNSGVSYSPGLTADAQTIDLTDFTANFLVYDNCSNTQNLIFGTAGPATECFDASYDCYGPPPPPPGALGGWFLTCNEILFCDYKQTNTDSERIWDLWYQEATGCQISFSWNPAELPAEGNFHLVDPANGQFVNVNMRTTSTYTDLLGWGHLRIVYNYEITASSTVEEGWNMISLPLVVQDGNYLTLFPNAETGSLYGYNGSYYTTDTLDNCLGYWLKFPGSELVTIQGDDLTECTVDLNAGWNMIGGPNCSVLQGSIIDPGGIIVPGTLYGYSGSYFPATSVEPLKGYWIKASSSGTITLSCAAPVANSGGNDLSIPVSTVTDFGKIEISDAREYNQTLYFNSKLEESISIESFSMPPMSPEGSFDARLMGGYRLSESDEVTIQLQSSSYPISVTLTDLNYEQGYGYVLEEIDGGVEVGSHRIVEGVEIVISNENVSLLKISKHQALPTTYSLEQNYPNPFNPSTTIKFAVPKESIVKLSIYNVLGELATTLVNEQKKRGYYEYKFNASNLASGVYLYRLQVVDRESSSGQGFVETKKMVFMK